MIALIRAVGGCVRVGETVWNTLKGGGIEKSGGETKILKRGVKLGQGVGALKREEGVLEPLTNYGWSFILSHFLCKNLNVVCADYLIIFQDLLRTSFATFLRRRLNTRKPFKNVIKWKTKEAWKGNVGKFSLYSQYFSPGAGSNVHKTYFYLLHLTKKYFIFLDQKSSI